MNSVTKKNPNLAKTESLRGLLCPLPTHSLFPPLCSGHAGLTDQWPQECNLSDVLASKLACCSQEDSPHKNKNKTGVWS